MRTSTTGGGGGEKNSKKHLQGAYACRPFSSFPARRSCQVMLMPTHTTLRGGEIMAAPATHAATFGSGGVRVRAEACRLPNAQVWAGRSFNVEGTKTEGSQLLLLDLLHNYLLDGWYHGSQLGPQSQCPATQANSIRQAFSTCTPHLSLTLRQLCRAQPGAGNVNRQPTDSTRGACVLCTMQARRMLAQQLSSDISGTASRCGEERTLFWAKS